MHMRSHIFLQKKCVYGYAHAKSKSILDFSPENSKKVYGCTKKFPKILDKF